VTNPSGYGPPQPPPGYYGPPQPPPRKHHIGRNVFLGCGGLIVLVIIVVIIVVVVALSHSGTGSKSASGSGPGASSGSIGSKVRDGKFQFVITSVSHAKNVGDTAQGFGDTAQGEYTVLHVSVTDISNQAQTLDDSAQFVFDSKGRQFSAATQADIDGNGGNGGGVFLNQINPGDTVHGKIYFDLPPGTTASKAVLHDDLLSGGVTVSLHS
jgi:Domain of unknown function (DUF4352)